ncbi:transposase [Blastococcus deserti]|uniref:Transposase n=1 Tax=Blastococcus deserti TaxID=2259033 RepID=A0ABW4XG22_9ACTN
MATTEVIERAHSDNYGIYGVRKMHAELRRRGHQGARCTVARLMRRRACADQQGEWVAHHRARQWPRHPPRPGRSCLHRDRPAPTVGRRHHLLPDVLRHAYRCPTATGDPTPTRHPSPHAQGGESPTRPQPAVPSLGTAPVRLTPCL